MAPTAFYHQRPYRNLTIADWMTPASRSRLITKQAPHHNVHSQPPPSPPAPPPAPPPPPPVPLLSLPSPAPIRILELASAVKEPTELELLSANGRGRWKSTPKDKHVVRMYISAAVSVFAEVMRPSLEIKTSRLFSSFSETVDAILPYWDNLEPKLKAAWARRARDTNKKDHYVYLRAARPEKVPAKEKSQKKRKHHRDDAEEEGYETDPDELPGIVCEVVAEEEIVVEKKSQWVSGFLPKKRTTAVLVE